MACIGDETQTEVSAVTTAWRQNESHPMPEIRSVNTRLQTTTAVIGTVVIGGLAWLLVWAITEEQTYRALGILIGAAIGAVVGARHEVLILRIMVILMVVCWVIILTGLRLAVIIKAIVKTITGKDWMEVNLIIAVTITALVLGILCLGLSVGIRYEVWQMLTGDVVYFGGGATAVIAVIAVIVAVIGIPVHSEIMTLVVTMCSVLISRMIWAAIHRICAPIFALEFKLSCDAIIKAAVSILVIMGFYTAVEIIIITVLEDHLMQNLHDQTPPFN